MQRDCEGFIGLTNIAKSPGFWRDGLEALSALQAKSDAAHNQLLAGSWATKADIVATDFGKLQDAEHRRVQVLCAPHGWLHVLPRVRVEFPFKRRGIRIESHP